MFRSLAIVGAALALLTSLPAVPSAAQYRFPANTKYVSTHGRPSDPYGLRGIDVHGKLTTFIGMPVIQHKMLEMNPTNDGLILQQLNGVHFIDLSTGATNFTTLNGSLRGATVDETGGIAWLTQTSLYRSTSILGTNPIFLSTVVGGGARLLCGPCWDGTTGDFVACTDGTPAGQIMQSFDRNGVITRTIGNIGFAYDCAWSPWTGDIFATNISQVQIIRVTIAGAVRTVFKSPPSIPPAPPVPSSFKVEHQNSANIEQLLVCEMNTTLPQASIFRLSGTGVITSLSNGRYPAGDIEELYSRPLWATGAWRAGGIGLLSLNMGPGFAGNDYRLALSLSHGPGINLRTAYLHVAPDVLFRLTAHGDVPGLTRGFAGRLDAAGRSVSPVSVVIPGGTRGLRVFAGGIAFDRHGITGATNCWGITIE